MRLSVEISRWDDLLRPAVEIIRWDYRWGSPFEIIHWAEQLKWFAEINCCVYLLRLSPKFSYWDYLLSTAAESICCKLQLRLFLLRSALASISWEYLFSLSVENSGWDYLLTLSVEVNCLDYLLKSAFEIMLRTTAEIICWVQLLT